MSTRFFRAGVGTVIYNDEGQVALFKRNKHPVGVWQFQQGGIDLEENPEDTLWRELKEEIGLERAEITQVDEFPNWTVYATADALADASKSRIGQAHTWYFLKLADGVNIDLTKALEDEASDFKWVTFAEAIAQTEDLKKHVYQELEQYFNQHII